VKKLKVNFDEIQKAMEDVLRDTFDYFFDTETGEVIAFSEEIVKGIKSRLFDDTDEYEEADEEFEYVEYDEEPDIPGWMLDEVELALEILLDESGRYMRIPERSSNEAYRSMAEFIEKVENPLLKNELAESLDGRGAFRKFKDALVPHPKERKRWHGYNAKVMKRQITEWLRSIDVEPVP